MCPWRLYHLALFAVPEPASSTNVVTVLILNVLPDEVAPSLFRRNQGFIFWQRFASWNGPLLRGQVATWQGFFLQGELLNFFQLLLAQEIVLDVKLLVQHPQHRLVVALAQTLKSDQNLRRSSQARSPGSLSASSTATTAPSLRRKHSKVKAILPKTGSAKLGFLTPSFQNSTTNLNWN